MIMLKSFCVENYRGFEHKLCFDLGTPNNYSFNSEVIENGCVTKGIIFGLNSCGKSNFGLAIFDIITHLTEKQRLPKNDYFFLNLNGRKSFAEFAVSSKIWWKPEDFTSRPKTCSLMRPIFEPNVSRDKRS